MSEVVHHRRCAHCRAPINKNDSYFQDIPGLGDLCKPCHVKWRNPEEEGKKYADTTD